MNKKELSEELGLSLTTISRYIELGMPFEKIGGRYSFDIDTVQHWIINNIDSRMSERFEPSERMTPKQAAAKAFELLERWRPYVDFEKMIKDFGRQK